MLNLYAFAPFRCIFLSVFITFLYVSKYLDRSMPGTELQCQSLAVENSKLLHQFSLNFSVHLFPLSAFCDG